MLHERIRKITNGQARMGGYKVFEATQSIEVAGGIGGLDNAIGIHKKSIAGF